MFVFTLRVPRPCKFQCFPKDLAGGQAHGCELFQSGMKSKVSTGGEVRSTGLHQSSPRSHTEHARFLHMGKVACQERIRSLGPRVFIVGEVHVSTPAWHGTQTPDSPKETGSSTDCIVRSHSFVILSLCCSLGNAGNPLEIQDPRCKRVFLRTTGPGWPCYNAFFA